MPEQLLHTISGLLDSVYAECEKLEKTRKEASGINNVIKCAKTYSDNIHPIMQSIRGYTDTFEEVIPKNLWPVPSYSDMMFNV